MHIGPHSTLLASRPRLSTRFSTVRDANNILVMLDIFSQNLPDHGIMQLYGLVPSLHVAYLVIRPVRIDLDLESLHHKISFACIYALAHPSLPDPPRVTCTDLLR
jgi:hypothetical protein